MSGLNLRDACYANNRSKLLLHNDEDYVGGPCLAPLFCRRDGKRLKDEPVYFKRISAAYMSEFETTMLSLLSRFINTT